MLSGRPLGDGELGCEEHHSGKTDDGHAWIGAEHPHRALRQCALVQADYRSGDGGIGQVALVGPMRMAYATARAAVLSVARVLERLLA